MKVLPILVADTFAGARHIHGRWRDLLPAFTVEHWHVTKVPNEKPHPHGWMAFSCMWPVLWRRYQRVEVHLVRWLDGASENVEYELLDYAKRLAMQYGHLVWSNSWGTPRNTGFDDIYASWWAPWAQEVNELLADNPRIVYCQSSGNEGPEYSGWPQSHLSADAFIVGATKRNGKPAQFTSRNGLLHCTGWGKAVHVANPYTGKYVAESGTSFSCPKVASMAAAHLLESESNNRDSFTRKVQREGTRPAEAHDMPIDYRNEVWGLRNVEPWYQQEGDFNGPQYPGAVAQRMAQMLSFAHDTTLPTPQPKGAPPILPRY